MAYFAGFGGSVVINNTNSLPLSVNITATSGAAITVYSDAARSTAVTLPDSVTGSKTYYIINDGDYTVSIKFGGVEIAGQGAALTTTLTGGCVAAVTPSLDPGELGTLSSSYPRRRRQVTGRSAFPSSQRDVTNGSSNTQVQQVHAFVLNEDVSDLSFTFQNAYRSAPGVTTLGGQSTVTMRCGLWDGVDTHPLFWHNGSRDLAIEPGAVVSTVPLVFKGKAGQRLWLVRRMTWASAPTVFPAATVLALTSTEVNEVGTALTDRTTSYGQFFTRTAGNFCVLPPVAITATGPARPVVGILGDSIASDGSNDYNTDDLDYGWAQGGLADAGVPYTNFGQSSLALNQITASKVLRAQLHASLPAAGVTHLLVPLATNDWNTGRTAAQILADFAFLRDELAPLGVKVIPCTAPPKTNGNTGTLPAGETTTFTERASLNAQLRANNGVGAGYFDLARICQDTTDANRWRLDIRAATDIAITSGGTGYNQNDAFILPGGGTIVATTVTGGAVTASVATKGLGGWVVDPGAALSPVRVVSNNPSTRGVSSGTGATFTYTGVAGVAATADGVHPSAAMTRFIRQQFAAQAPLLFTL